MTDSQSPIQTILRELNTTLSAIDLTSIPALTQSILTSKRIFLAGKGRTGLQLRAFAMRLMHLGLTAHVVDDVTTPGITSGDLLIIASGSGRTASLLHYANCATQLQAPLALITGNPDSPMAQQAELLVYVPASNPKAKQVASTPSILPMGSLFEHTLGLFFEMVTLELMSALDMDSEAMFTRHANLE